MKLRLKQTMTFHWLISSFEVVLWMLLLFDLYAILTRKTTGQDNDTKNRICRSLFQKERIKQNNKTIVKYSWIVYAYSWLIPLELFDWLLFLFLLLLFRRLFRAPSDSIVRRFICTAKVLGIEWVLWYLIRVHRVCFFVSHSPSYLSILPSPSQ